MFETTCSGASADPPRASASPSAAPPTASETTAKTINEVRRAENCHRMRTPIEESAARPSSHLIAGRIVKRLTNPPKAPESPSVLLTSSAALAAFGSENARASVAQLEEQLTLNQLVVGSSPTGGTRNSNTFRCAN